MPGVTLSAAELAAYCRINPRTAFSFARNGHLLGGIAFLYLNDDGLDALILDDIDLRHPQPRFSPQTDEVPAAIYWWALAAKGRGIGGLGEIARLFASPQYSLSTSTHSPAAGTARASRPRWASSAMPSWQPDLWTYRRAANREACPSRNSSASSGLRGQPIMLDSVSRSHSQKAVGKRTSVRIARTFNDLMTVTAIRSAVYLAEQDCPIEEEFDGNDFVAAHFIGYVGDEPVACLRVRFFGDFAKVERLAVRHQYRRSVVAFKLVKATVEYLKRKGFRKDLWSGAGPAGRLLGALRRQAGCRIARPITFSDFSYTEMVLEIEPSKDAITLDSDPYVIIRPEGDWDTPGVLDRSKGREATSPLAATRRPWV